MAITMEQAINAKVFHANGCQPKRTPERWRRNGRTQLWKTRPTEFRVPVKHGLYHYGYITQIAAHLVHAAEDCPVEEYRGW